MFLFICFANASCQLEERSKTEVQPAFYHWQTQLNLTQVEREYLDSIQVEKIYVKFFDVDWDEPSRQPVPLATVEIDTAKLSGLDIVPTIFITNRTLLNLPMQEIDTLAGRIFQKIESLQKQSPNEIQFDCDWTEQTQAKYFALLESLKMKSRPSSTVHRPPYISATIRLHQLKYFDKTGVPPVDRGMLMCYNMGDLDDWATENSILDIEVLKTYLPSRSAINYPLPLDLALPLFRWGVLFRDGSLIKLLNGLSQVDLRDPSRFKQTAPNRFEVVKSTYLQAHYLYTGDQLRLEAVSQKDFQEVAKLLGRSFSKRPATVAFYHLDSALIQLFPKEKIKEALMQF